MFGERERERESWMLCLSDVEMREAEMEYGVAEARGGRTYLLPRGIVLKDLAVTVRRRQASSGLAPAWVSSPVWPVATHSHDLIITVRFFY